MCAAPCVSKLEAVEEMVEAGCVGGGGGGGGVKATDVCRAAYTENTAESSQRVLIQY